MMTEADESGVVFVCEVCGWHTADRAAAVWHAMKAHSGALAPAHGREVMDAGKSWKAMINGAIEGCIESPSEGGV